MSNRQFSKKGTSFRGNSFRKKNSPDSEDDYDEDFDAHESEESIPAKSIPKKNLSAKSIPAKNHDDEADLKTNIETEFSTSFLSRMSKVNSSRNANNSSGMGTSNDRDDSKAMPESRNMPDSRNKSAFDNDDEDFDAGDNSSDLATNLNKLDENIRPRRLEDFIGQGELRKNLRVYLDATLKRQNVMDHLLFYGNPGLGKTTLAHIIASELGVNIVSTSGPALMRGGDLAAILTNLQENDVFFIDEIHRMPMQVEEVLYPAMEDFKLDLVIGQGPAAKTVKLDIEPFTLIGATTRLGLLSSPLRDRFGIISRLEFYTPQELSEVVIRAARIMNMSITTEGAIEIGKRSRGTPRIANRLLRRVRDFASVYGTDSVDEEQARHALSRLDVDEMGLDEMDRKILSILIDHYDGGPVGLKTLAVACSEEVRTIEEIYEPYLIQCGLIKRTSQGRTATNRAYKHMKYLG